MNKRKTYRFMPLWLALSVVLGIFIGTFFANRFGGNRLSIINSGSNKLNDLLHIIDDQYVDTVNMSDLVETAMPQILSELDPHSVYISAKDVQTANDDLKGSFFGIGIEFTIRQDTIHVQNVIANGPSERAGLLAGDKIVEVDGKPFVGKEVTNDVAIHKLKGEKDTKVQVGIMRYKEKTIRRITITRGEIPMKSVTATYMLNEATGYIKIKNFGEKTYPELLIALATLAQEGFENLVIDLRGNTGGYLMSAVQMANEFLPKGRLIVYTQGRKSARQEYRSDGRGSYQQIPLVVLIYEGSASASEIFAGAIQDNDRGTIIGRRSFGKGLVQQPVTLHDGSMIRLTIARYYSPSGRCIQKPYTQGDSKDYESDILARYEHGEFFSQDSIRHTGPEYHTRNGRTYDYTDENRHKLASYKTMHDLEAYLKKINTVELFAQYADKNGLKRRNLMIQRSHKLLERYVNSRIIYNMMGEAEWTEYLNSDDPAISETLHLFREGKAFPHAEKIGKQQKLAKTFDYRGPHTRAILTAQVC